MKNEEDCKRKLAEMKRSPSEKKEVAEKEEAKENEEAEKRAEAEKRGQMREARTREAKGWRMKTKEKA